ncbi:DUF4439 domain-containing protein [Sinomonas flava]|uniref:DUF4439 domain-containing protein n=1 Tax=Sinomonas flava TaxID=496857 RepID=UPI0039A759E6
MNSPTPGPARPDARRRSRPGMWLAAVGVALAVGSGAALLAAPAAVPPGPTASETALAHAEADAVVLAVAAAGLSTSGAAAAPVDGAQQAAARAARVLDLQRGLLAGSPGPASPTTPAPAATPPADAAGVAEALDTSAQARRRDLGGVDGPTARLLASLAAGQQVQERLRAAVGGASAPVPPPTAPPAVPSAEPSPSSVPSCNRAGGPSSAGRSSAGEPSAGSAQGSSELATTVRAEQAAVWTYTVLAARSEGAVRAGHLASAAAHASQEDAARAIADASCVRLPADAAGFALAPDAATPASLAALEDSAAQAWSQLVGAAAPQQREAAADRLAAAARRLAPLGITPEEEAFPGHTEARRAASQAPQPSPAASPGG